MIDKTRHRTLAQSDPELFIEQEISEKKNNVINIVIDPKVVLKGLLFFITILLLANLITIFFKTNLQGDDVFRLTKLFTFNDEANIPTFYSSLALFFSAILLLIIGVAHRKRGSAYLSWLGLASVFLMLSIDEAASVHERLTIPLRELLNTSGFLHFAWVIPYSIMVLLLFVLYARFLINLPKKTMILFLVAGITYITGALGFEMLGASWAYLHETDNLIYSLIVTCEEFLEILGIVFFIYALIQYISEQIGKLTIKVGEDAAIDKIDFENNF